MVNLIFKHRQVCINLSRKRLLFKQVRVYIVPQPRMEIGNTLPMSQQVRHITLSDIFQAALNP